MPITKNAARQEPIAAFVDFSFADIVNNVAAPAIDLPVNAIVIDGSIVTTEAWNSTTSDVMDVGDAGGATRYLTDGNIRALGARVPIVPTGFTHDATNNVLRVVWTSGGGVPTTGKCRLEVRYYVKGRAAFSQG